MTATATEPFALNARINLFIRDTLQICASITQHADAAIENLLALEAAVPEIDPVELRCDLPLDVQSALSKAIGYRIAVEKSSRAKLRKLCANWDVDQGEVFYFLGWSHGMRFWTALKGLSEICPSWTNALNLLRAASRYRRTDPLFVARQGVDRNAPGISLFDLRLVVEDLQACWTLSNMVDAVHELTLCVKSSQDSPVAATQSDQTPTNVQANAGSRRRKSTSTSSQSSVQQLLPDDSGICLSPDGSTFSDFEDAVDTNITSACSTMTPSTSGKRASTEVPQGSAKRHKRANASESIAQPEAQTTNDALVKCLHELCAAQAATAMISPSDSATFIEATYVPNSVIKDLASSSEKIVLPLLLSGTHWVIGIVFKPEGEAVSIHLYDSFPSVRQTQQASRILASFCGHYLPDCGKSGVPGILQRAAPTQSADLDSDVHVFAIAVYEFTGRHMPYKINTGLWRQSMAELLSQDTSWDGLLPVHRHSLDVKNWVAAPPVPVFTDWKQCVEWSNQVKGWEATLRSTLVIHLDEEMRDTYELLAEAQEARTVISLQVQALENKEAEAGGQQTQQKRKRLSKAAPANQHYERWQTVREKMDDIVQRLTNSLRDLEWERTELKSSP